MDVVVAVCLVWIKPFKPTDHESTVVFAYVVTLIITADCNIDEMNAEHGVEQVCFKTWCAWEVDQDYTEDNLDLHTIALRC